MSCFVFGAFFCVFCHLSPFIELLETCSTLFSVCADLQILALPLSSSMASTLPFLSFSPSAYNNYLPLIAAFALSSVSIAIAKGEGE